MSKGIGELGGRCGVCDNTATTLHGHDVTGREVYYCDVCMANIPTSRPDSAAARASAVAYLRGIQAPKIAAARKAAMAARLAMAEGGAR